MIKILADSTCDLSPELVEKYNIGIIPLYVRLGDEEYKDGKNITPQDLYAWSNEHGQTPKTAAPSVEDIEQFLDKDSDDEYIVFPISSSMSASFNNCRLAAEDLEMSNRVHVIDSANLSTGIGLQVLYAAELAAKAGVKEMWLTHYSPSLNHPEEYAKEVKKIFPATVITKDGRTTELRFTDED